MNMVHVREINLMMILMTMSVLSPPARFRITMDIYGLLCLMLWLGLNL